MRSYPLNMARAEFSKLVDRALAGEPQRVTRYGKDAVVIVSEEEWNKRKPKYANLGELLVAYGTAAYSTMAYSMNLISSKRDHWGPASWKTIECTSSTPTSCRFSTGAGGRSHPQSLIGSGEVGQVCS